jgi:UDP-N-acetyl-D-mannosaminuronic acid dehydrogenase
MSDTTGNADICVMGGGGHVGLPLSIVFASRGKRVRIFDINRKTIETVMSGQMPFMEYGAEPVLKEALAKGMLDADTVPACVQGVPAIVITIGTPVDEFLNPSLKAIRRCMDEILPYLADDQLIVLRSTVYPGVTESIAEYLSSRGRKTRVAFCPERIVQGYAVQELQTLPQIVSGTTPEAEEEAAALFALISPEIIRLSTREAEMVKLFNNAYRYIQFAVANQFYLIAESAGVDYYRVMDGMQRKYPRGAVPGAGFAAGPCLFKDTMQLSAFYKNQFSLGYAAMLVNESMPQFVADRIAARFRLSETTVGLLGMAFKANIDDPRSSLSYKLKKLLGLKARRVLTTDPYVENDPDLLPLDEVIAKSDVLVLCAPHDLYRALDLQGKFCVDIWNFWKPVGPASWPVDAPEAHS